MHHFIVLPIETHFPKEIEQKTFQDKRKAFFQETHVREFMEHSSLWNNINAHNYALLVNKIMESTEILEITSF